MTAPALLIAIPLIAGILLGSGGAAAVARAPLILALTWVATAVALHGARTRGVTAGLTAGFLLSGVILGDLASRDVRQPPLRVWLQADPHGEPVRVTGVLREDAVRGANG